MKIFLRSHAMVVEGAIIWLMNVKTSQNSNKKCFSNGHPSHFPLDCHSVVQSQRVEISMVLLLSPYKLVVMIYVNSPMVRKISYVCIKMNNNFTK